MECSEAEEEVDDKDVDTQSKHFRDIFGLKKKPLKDGEDTVNVAVKETDTVETKVNKETKVKEETNQKIEKDINVLNVKEIQTVRKDIPEDMEITILSDDDNEAMDMDNDELDTSEEKLEESKNETSEHISSPVSEVTPAAITRDPSITIVTDDDDDDELINTEKVLGVKDSAVRLGKSLYKEQLKPQTTILPVNNSIEIPNTDVTKVDSVGDKPKHENLDTIENLGEFVKESEKSQGKAMVMFGNDSVDKTETKKGNISQDKQKDRSALVNKEPERKVLDKEQGRDIITVSAAEDDLPDLIITGETGPDKPLNSTKKARPMKESNLNKLPYNAAKDLLNFSKSNMNFLKKKVQQVAEKKSVFKSSLANGDTKKVAMKWETSFFPELPQLTKEVKSCPQLFPNKALSQKHSIPTIHKAAVGKPEGTICKSDDDDVIVIDSNHVDYAGNGKSTAAKEKMCASKSLEKNKQGDDSDDVVILDTKPQTIIPDLAIIGDVPSKSPKSSVEVGKSERSSFAIDKSERSSAAVDKSERSSAAVDKSERSPSSVDQSERLSTSVDQSERSPTSVDQSERLSAAVSKSERSSAAVDKSEILSAAVDQSERSPTSVDQSERSCIAVDQSEVLSTAVNKSQKAVERSVSRSSVEDDDTSYVDLNLHDQNSVDEESSDDIFYGPQSLKDTYPLKEAVVQCKETEVFLDSVNGGETDLGNDAGETGENEINAKSVKIESAKQRLKSAEVAEKLKMLKAIKKNGNNGKDIISPTKIVRGNFLRKDENAKLIETYTETDSRPFNRKENFVSSSQDSVIVLSDSD